MKTDVVRWSVEDKDDRNKSYEIHLCKDASDFDQSDNICVPEFSLPQLPRTLASTQIPASTKANTIKEPLPRHLAPTAIDCDEINVESSFHLLSKNENIPYETHTCQCACATRDVVSLKQFVPLSAAHSDSCTFSTPTNVPSRQSQSSSIRRQIICSLSSSKLLRFYLQLIYLVFLCNINVGVAVSISDKLPNELNGREAREEVHMESKGHFTHTWAVHIPNGDSGLVDDVAREHGFVNLGKIFDDHYHFAHHKVSKRSLEPALNHQTRLDEDARVLWSAQQKAKSRSKRDFIRMRPSRTSSRSLSLVDAVSFSDPKWSLMWYLNRGGDLDMNVIPAWKEGITGKGIVVTILDDGLESDHPDIEHNYDPKASYDVNSHDEDPMPHYDMTDSNRHGTRCAGEVAATANNSICAVGIAYGASVGGVRMLDGDVTDAVEARSLSLNPQHIDIYSASWGPDDDGKTVDGPGELASRAFIEGVTKGRNGKGSIFIWASGNGGREQDNCNCDGYTNSIWTLSISSATEEGNVPWYSEKCSSTLATTYSSGGQSEKQVVTTDLHHSCTVSHTGTSASAPLAAGIAALVLESNQNLTWRDLQHIVVRTAKPANLRDPTWSRNGIGRRISHSFGYGLMDAAAMVKVARTWKMVPEQQRCEINAPHVDKVIPPKSYITLQLTVKHCLSVNYLEHVQAKITLTSQRRGDIQLNLKSPAGTKVTLLTTRVHDISRSGFNQWPFMSVHTWGESPHGNWQLEIHNEGRFMGHAMLREWSLIFYGTTFPISPNDPKSTPRASTNEFTTPNSSATATTTNMHQFYSEQYPRILSNNLGVLAGGGRVQSSGKISSKPAPNKAVYVPANPPIAVAGNINNKKQQQLQKQQSHQGIIETFDPLIGPTNKIKSKNNGKNKSSEAKGNKNNNNGKSSSNKKDPTSTSTPNAKNKFYRISNKKLNNKSPALATAHRSKTPSLQSNERLSNYDNRQLSSKVIGDLVVTSSGKTPQKSTSPVASSYSKLAVKATKQIKESQSALQSHEKLSTNDQRIPKMFERYEKIQAIFPEFQPYQGPKEAIISTASNRKQFQAYQAASDVSTDASFYAPSSLRPSTSNGFSKPSRENSKKSSVSFMQEQRPQNLQQKTKQQLLVATVTATTVTSKDRAINQRQGSAASKATKKTTNAQITQWDLIFHGTETPAQPEDPVNSSPGQFSPFGNDMDHNHLDFDPNAASGQWRNVEQVGESSVMSSDKTNTACLKATIDQRCLDIEFEVNQMKALIAKQNSNIIELKETIQKQNEFIIGELASMKVLMRELVEEKKQHSEISKIFPIKNTEELQRLEANIANYNEQDLLTVVQKLCQRGGISQNLHNLIAPEIFLNYNYDGIQKQRAFKVFQAINNIFYTCAFPTFIYDGRCYLECPPHTFAPAKQERSRDSFYNFKANNSEENEELESIDRKRSALYTNEADLERSCITCDRSCMRCYGPLNSQCSTCFPGSQLRKALLSNETFCYVFTERSSGNSADGSLSLTSATNGAKNGLRSDLTMYLMIVIPAVVIVSILVVLNTSLGKKIPCRNCGSGKESSYSYDRVALLPEEEQDGDIIDGTDIDVDPQSVEIKNNCVVEVELPSEIVDSIG